MDEQKKEIFRRQREFFYGKSWDPVTESFKEIHGAVDGAIRTALLNLDGRATFEQICNAIDNQPTNPTTARQQNWQTKVLASLNHHATFDGTAWTISAS